MKLVSMIVNKIVGFAFANTNNLSYIKNQLNAIKNSFPDLEIELADETDSRLKRYIKQKPGGFKLPLYMLLKNGMYKDHKAGKYRNHIIFAWLHSIPSLNA